MTITLDAVNKAKGKMDEVSQEGERMGGRMKAVGMAVAAAGAAATAAIIKATESMKEFNRHIEMTAVTAGATAGDIEELKERALELGNAVVPAEMVSKGFEQLMRITHDTGLSIEYMDGFMAQSMVTGTDLAATVANVTDVMGMFELQIGDTGAIMDLSAAIYARSSWSIDQVQTALMEVAPAAKTAGLNLQETASIMGVFAEGGMSAGMATQGLQIMFGKLVDDTAMVTDALASVGVSTVTTTGAMRPMMSILEDLADQFQMMPDSTEKTSLAVELFGTRSGARMGAMLSKGSIALDDFQVNIEASAGMMENMSEVVEDSVTPWANFKNSIHEAGIKFGAFTEPISGVLTALTSLLMPIGMLMMMYPALTAGVASFNIVQKLSAAWTGIVTAATWLWNAALYANPIVWIIALIIALIAVIVLLVKHWDKVKEAVGNFAKGAKEKLGALWGWMKAGWEKMKNAASGAWDKLKNIAGNATKAARGFIEKNLEMGKWFYDKGTEWGGKLKDGIKSMGEKMKGWFSDQFSKWLNIGSKLYELGRGLMEWLKNGIESMKDKIGEACEGIADKIKGWFGGSLPEVGPLRHIVEMGEDLMGGYTRGMVKGAALTQSDLASALSGLVGGGGGNNYSATMNVSGMGMFDDGQLQMLYRRLEQLNLSKARRSTP